MSKCAVTVTLTFDIDVSVHEADWPQLQEVGQVLQTHFEWVPVLKLQVLVDVKTQVSLNVTTQRLQ